MKHVFHVLSPWPPVWGQEAVGTNVNKPKWSISFKGSEGKVQQAIQENKRLGEHGRSYWEGAVELRIRTMTRVPLL